MEADLWRKVESAIRKDAAMESALKCQRANDYYQSHF